jgi:hypothetical protein
LIVTVQDAVGGNVFPPVSVRATSPADGGLIPLGIPVKVPPQPFTAAGEAATTIPACSESVNPTPTALVVVLVFMIVMLIVDVNPLGP